MENLIPHELHSEKGILVLRPQGPLEAEDFAAIAQETDAYIEKHGSLKGLMIVSQKFPGWEDVQGFIAHIKFVRDHHKMIKRVAFVSDSKFFEYVPQLAEHFVVAELKHLDSGEEKAANAWLSA